MHYKDKQSQYVPPSSYDDLEGNVKNFTEIDYDKKQTISVNLTNVDTDWEPIYRKQLIARIFEYAAVFCPIHLIDYTLRGEAQTNITWNQTLLEDPGISVWRLRDLSVLLENRQK